MTLLYYDPRFLEHDTGRHPECADRLRHITNHLDERGLSKLCRHPDWTQIDQPHMEAIHSREHLERVQSLAERGGGMVDADTVVSHVSFDIAKIAAGAVCHAVEQVMDGPDKRALCIVRPPGHHALADRAMGFCLLNNIALGAATALSKGAQRVLIFDWDVHHGNGTQAIFYNDPRVGFFSVHRWPFYPGTGSAEETGTGDGLGATRNLPVAFGTSRDEYKSLVLSELEDFAARIKPELVMISAGFDSHRADPIGSLGLEVEDFSWLTSAAVEVANTHAQGRLVSTLEGGYNPPVLAECVAAHLQTLRAEEE